MRETLTKYFKGDRVIWFVIMLLFIISLLVVYSSAGTLAFRYKEGNTTFYLFRHAVFLLVGVGITYFMHRVPYKYFSKLAKFLFIASIPLLFFTLIMGVTKNEAARWLTLPGLGIAFQTSDLAKFALIMYIARILSKNQDSKVALDATFKPIMISVIIICGLIFPENFSTAALLFATSLVLMFIGRVNVQYIFGAIGIIVVLAGIFIFVAYNSPNSRVGTWKHRIESFFNDEGGENYQVEQSKIAIVSGGIVGKGPGNSTQRNFIPHPYSDFIFAIIVEEYGAIGGIFVVFLYLFLLYRTGVIVRNCNRTFPAFLAIGLTLILIFQALANMAVAVNLIPVTGQTLPFISMGGTSILFTSIAFGIILSISRSINEGEFEDETPEAEPIVAAPIPVKQTKQTVKNLK